MLRAGPPVLVADATTRAALGLHHWVDGTFGVARHGGRTTAVAPNGRGLALHDLDRGLVEGLVHPARAIEGVVEPLDHASGGPLLVDPQTGDLVLVYHGERFRQGEPGEFWSFLGLAVSRDGGVSFRDLGPIITPECPEHDIRAPLVDVGSGGFVVHRGWMLVYFLERSAWGAALNLGVARAPVDEVLSAARAGRAPSFAKFHDGGFTEPGRGGRGTDLVDAHVIWCDVTSLAPDGDMLLLATTADMVDGQALWWVDARLSADGVSWSEPHALDGSTTREEQIYITVDGRGRDRCLAGDVIDLYRVRSTAPYRWDDARLERVELQVEVAPPVPPLDEARRERFARDGYVHIPGAVDADVVAALVAACEADDGESELTLGAMRFASNLYRRQAAVRSFLASPTVAALATALLGPDAWVRWDQAVWKGPGAPTFPLHQDNGYTGQPTEHLQIWVALTEMTGDNGGLVVVPGAHDRVAPHRWVGDHAVTEVPGPRRLIEARAGDVVAFSSLLPHTTGPNATDGTRLAYVAELLPLGVDDPTVPGPHLVACRQGRPSGQLVPHAARPHTAPAADADLP